MLTYWVLLMVITRHGDSPQLVGSTRVQPIETMVYGGLPDSR
jgi:hypothetical protein